MKLDRRSFISFICILLFFITITAVNAQNIDNIQDDTISHQNNSSYQINTNADVKNTTLSSDKINKQQIREIKQNKKGGHDVSSYDELYNTIEDIKINSNENAETINLNPGNYNITKTINWGNTTHTTKTLTINANNIILDGNKAYRFITVTNGYTLHLENITVNNCRAENGSVIINHGNTTINNSNFTDNIIENSERYGSGMVIINTGCMNVTNSNFRNNTEYCNGGSSQQFGGGVAYNLGNMSYKSSNFTDNTGLTGGVNFNYGYMLIVDCNFDRNKAIVNKTLKRGGEGGVNFNHGFSTMIIKSSNFTNNQARSGGVNHNTGNMTIITSNFHGNSVTREGGVNYNDISLSSNGTLNITDSNFTNNNATTSGGVNFIMRNSTAIITNSNFTNNTAIKYGGVLYIQNATVDVINSTFTSNAQNAGVIYDFLDKKCNIINSTFKNNTAEKYGSAIYNYDNNLIINGSTFIDNFDCFNTTIFSAEHITIINTTINNTIKLDYPFDMLTIHSPIVLKKIDMSELVSFYPEESKIIGTINETSKVVSINYTFKTAGRNTVKIEYPSYNTCDINVVYTTKSDDLKINIDEIGQLKRYSDENIIVSGNITNNGQLLDHEIEATIFIDDGAYENVKVIDGKFNTSLNISFFDPSEYKISVVINNLDQKICEDTYFEIIRRDLTINITPNSPKVMNIVDIKVDLIDEDGGKIKEDGGFVIYKINGKTIKDENGNTLKTEVINSSSRYKYQLPNNIGCGVYDIVVTYIGDRCYNTTKSTEQFTLKRLTIEDIKLTDITTKAYDMTNINIVVNDIKAKQLVGNTKVVIKLNNKTFTDYTMQNGVLNVTLNTAKLQLKNYTLTFKFAKNSFYDYKEQNINLCIVERNIKMNIDVNNPKTTQNLSLNVTIDDAGRTLNEGFVIFKINGKTLKDENGRTITVDVKNNTAQLNYILTSAYNAGSVNISAHYRAKNYI
ncbi:MAG: hypothetical protein PUF18_05955 [Methanosphaera sp.]|nr:hypothetical protein [Methanosphaera sp.]MDD6535038.1 hypothetical protein [Methanosphaera sp.]